MTKICPDKEVDYRNLWLAKIALKEKFHGPEAGMNELYEGIRRNDPNELLRIYCSGKLDQGDWESAARGYDVLFSKRNGRGSMKTGGTISCSFITSRAMISPPMS